jgi:hypothetical protein
MPQHGHELRTVKGRPTYKLITRQKVKVNATKEDKGKREGKQTKERKAEA